MATKITNLKSFREETSKYLAQIEKGTSFVVFRRSTPLFIVSPVDYNEEEGWEVLGDFSKMNGGGVPAKQVLAALRNK